MGELIYFHQPEKVEPKKEKQTLRNILGEAIEKWETTKTSDTLLDLAESSVDKVEAKIGSLSRFLHQRAHH